MLTKLEKRIILFLSFALILGLGVNASRHIKKDREIEVGESAYSNNITNEIPEGRNQPRRININKASLEELKGLKGVGKVLAQRIVDYRSSQREFATADELKNVKGIGEKILQENKNRMTTED